MMPNESNRAQDLPCDFLAFLEQRSGLDEQAVLDELGTFLVRYERTDEVRAKHASACSAARSVPTRTMRQARTSAPAAAA